MAQCATLRSPLRAATFRTVIGLVAVTGMRVGEVIRLDRPDVDWTEGLLLIRESKFGKSRQLPLHHSTLDALRAYAAERGRRQPSPPSPSLFVSTTGTRLIHEVLCTTFRRLADEIGISADHGPNPRLHDLRHSFAVRTLVNWSRSGADIEANLSRLSTYLGHADPRSTYWYLSASPELMAFAAIRLAGIQEQWS
jgi:integrase/recombinase XerD